MRAKITASRVDNAQGRYTTKELVGSWDAITYKGGELHNPVSVKCYMGRSASASVVYCNVWIHSRQTKGDYISISGSGTAGGYGYHKISAAVDEALRSALAWSYMILPPLKVRRLSLDAGIALLRPRLPRFAGHSVTEASSRCYAGKDPHKHRTAVTIVADILNH